MRSHRVKPQRGFTPRLAQPLEERRVPATLAPAHAHVAAIPSTGPDVSNLEGGGFLVLTTRRNGIQTFSTRVVRETPGWSPLRGVFLTRGDSVRGRVILAEGVSRPGLILNVRGTYSSSDGLYSLQYTAIGGTGSNRGAHGSGMLYMIPYNYTSNLKPNQVSYLMAYNRLPTTVIGGTTSATSTDPSTPTTPSVPTDSSTSSDSSSTTTTSPPDSPTTPPAPLSSPPITVHPPLVSASYLNGTIYGSRVMKGPSQPRHLSGHSVAPFQNLGDFTATGTISSDWPRPPAGSRVGTVTLTNSQGSIQVDLYELNSTDKWRLRYDIVGGQGAYQNASGSGPAYYGEGGGPPTIDQNVGGPVPFTLSFGQNYPIIFFPI